MKPIQTEFDAKLLGEQTRYRELASRYKALLVQNQTLEQRVEQAMQIRKSVKTHQIKATKKTGSACATAFLVASDWHIEETVETESVSGLNEFSIPVAKKRGEAFFRNALTLINICKRDVKLDDIVLVLGGDFISNEIHDELMEVNSLRPVDAVLMVQNWLATGIEFLLANTNCHLTIPCTSGNHARITKKIRHATEQGNSLEHLMYHSLALYFKGNPRVKFIIQKSYHTFLQVYDLTVRIHHGHNVRYQGGVGGLSIPLNKAISQWNKSRWADIDLLGHWHQFRDFGNAIVNGSLIGFSPYAVAIKADFEPPRQAFFLLDSKRGKTITAPILLD